MQLIQLFFIFGWPRRTKNVGPTEVIECPHCQNASAFHLVKQRRWAEFFFIPLLPLGRSKWLLMCEICGTSVGIEKTIASEFREIADAAAQYDKEKLSEQEYRDRVREIHDRIQREYGEDADPIESPADSWETSSSGYNASRSIQCPECNSEEPAEHVHCTKCGSKLREEITS